MKNLLIASIVLSFAMIIGCSGSSDEGKKKPIALDKVPADIMKIAKHEHPDFTFERAFTEVEDGKPVYELKGKSKTGKNIEVEVTHDGKLLK